MRGVTSEACDTDGGTCWNPSVLCGLEEEEEEEEEDEEEEEEEGDAVAGR